MPPQSDLVQESKLETAFHPHYTRHTFYKRGTSGRERRIRIHEKWRRERRLGQGAYGTVWLETCDRPARQDGLKVRAVKEIPVDSTTPDEIDYYQELEAVMKFSQEQYTSFVKSFGWFESPEAIYITMEYVPHGDLQKFLVQPIPEVEAKMITCQLAEGLHHMHKNGFTHRDLKPGNILVVNNGPHWLVQISDFGISKRLRPDQATLGTIRRGTLGFIAPEMLGFVHDRGYPHAVDIWSLGTVLFRMVTKKLFLTDFSLLQKYVVGEMPFPIDELDSHEATWSLKKLLQYLLEPSPKGRPSAAEVLSHEWIRDYAGSSTNETLSEKGNDEGGKSCSDTLGLDHHQTIMETGDIPSAAWSTDIVPVEAARPSHNGVDNTPKPSLIGPIELSIGGFASGPAAGLDEGRHKTEGEALATLREEDTPQTQPESTQLTARFIVDEVGNTIEIPCFDPRKPPARFNFPNSLGEDPTERPGKGGKEGAEAAPEVLKGKASIYLGHRYMSPTVEGCFDDDEENSNQDLAYKSNLGDKHSITSHNSTLGHSGSHLQSEPERSPSAVAVAGQPWAETGQDGDRREQQRSASPSEPSIRVRGHDSNYQQHFENMYRATSYMDKTRKVSYRNVQTSSPPLKLSARRKEMVEEWLDGQDIPPLNDEPRKRVNRNPQTSNSSRRSSEKQNTAYVQDADGNSPSYTGAGAELNYDRNQRATLETASGKKIAREIASETEAKIWNIPKSYSLKDWDRRKRPLMVIGSVFDALSLGAWMLDWVAFYKDEGTPIEKRVAKTIEYFALLLEDVDDRGTAAERYRGDLRLSDEEKELFEDFLESYQRLFDRLQKLLTQCDKLGSLAKIIVDAEGEKCANEDTTAREVFAVLFDQDMDLDMMESLIDGMRTWTFRYDVNIGEIIARHVQERPKQKREQQERATALYNSSRPHPGLGRSQTFNEGVRYKLDTDSQGRNRSRVQPRVASEDSGSEEDLHPRRSHQKVHDLEPIPLDYGRSTGYTVNTSGRVVPVSEDLRSRKSQQKAHDPEPIPLDYGRSTRYTVTTSGRVVPVPADYYREESPPPMKKNRYTTDDVQYNNIRHKYTQEYAY